MNTESYKHFHFFNRKADVISRLASLLFIVYCVASGLRGVEYEAQQIDASHFVRFGQPLLEIEQVLQKQALPDDSGVGRMGKDLTLKIGGVKLDFDSGRLWGMTFSSSSFFPPIAAFPAPWQNLNRVDSRILKIGMPRVEVINYIAAWESRAKVQGIRKIMSESLVSNDEYRIRYRKDSFAEYITILFGPERLTRNGGSWSSGVTLVLSPQVGVNMMQLESIFIYCDEFNTRSRAPIGSK